VAPGPADRSYGIQVARLAGLPRRVIQRAQRLLAQAPEASFSPQLRVPAVSQPALPLFEIEPDPIRAELEALDLNRMTPLEALAWLAERQKRG
jgi:DNA mismatch repair protein MutS